MNNIKSITFREQALHITLNVCIMTQILSNNIDKVVELIH